MQRSARQNGPYACTFSTYERRGCEEQQPTTTCVLVLPTIQSPPQFSVRCSLNSNKRSGNKLFFWTVQVVITGEEDERPYRRLCTESSSVGYDGAPLLFSLLRYSSCLDESSEVTNEAVVLSLLAQIKSPHHRIFNLPTGIQSISRSISNTSERHAKPHHSSSVPGRLLQPTTQQPDDQAAHTRTFLGVFV